MGFTSSSGSSQGLTDVSHGTESLANASNHHNQLKFDLILKKDGLDQAHKKETYANFPEAVDVDDQINFIDRLSEESDYMWLSSDSLSSSLLSSDDSQDFLGCDCLRLSLKRQISSISLSTTISDVSLDKRNEAYSDGSNDSPKSEMPLVSSRKMACQEKKEKNVEELHRWLVGKERKSYSVGDSEISNSYQIEDPSVSNVSCALHTRSQDLPSWDFDRTDIWVSSLDLEREDSELLGDRQKEFDVFDFDFPSPSFSAFSAMRHHQIQSSSPRSLTSVGQGDEVKSTTTDLDEPLFWPLDYSLYSRLDCEKFLCPSPSKVEIHAHIAGTLGSKLTRLRLHQNSSQANRKGTQGLGRRITCSPTLKSVTAKYETKCANNGAWKTKSTPSRLSRPTKFPHQHPCNLSKRRGKPQLKIDVQKHGCSSAELSDRPFKELELYDSVSERDSIESIVGLSEFDGHEGTNDDFGDQFTLYLSPCGGLMPVKNIESVK
ncbi:hypothetical protein Cni_G21537 [Canna indica]|uniref:Uncharacterized protein n=1 Tax=Canna indica TaxID=4628 RepID=A0AAQ3KQV1_9LILI|nr:hypothetical protein Cni_G21537 [Canna indica]